MFISTPDQWHAPMALAAVKAGNEGRLLADLVHQRKRIFRVESDGRSLEPFHRAAELVRNGRLGRLHTIRSGCPREVFPEEPEEVAPGPLGLDHDFW